VGCAEGGVVGWRPGCSVDELPAADLPRAMQTVRDRIAIATRAVAAVRSRLEEVGRAALLAEAGEWDAERDRRQALLDEHDVKKRELLEALEAHTGVEWAVKKVRPVWETGDRVVPVPPGKVLLREVEFAERVAWVLREVASGRDPHPELAAMGLDPSRFYTASTWGAEAVRPAPAYLAWQARERARAEAAEAAEAVAEEVEEVEGTKVVKSLRSERSEREAV
jgi:hypothetical protein